MLVNDNSAGIRARVLSPFAGVRDGEIYPVKLVPGDIIRGDLALAAVGAGKARLISTGIETKEVDADDSPFQTGPVELSSSRRPGQAKTPKTSRKRVEKRSF